jgi:acyl transferase domain-containing protein/acyl carrier protein
MGEAASAAELMDIAIIGMSCRFPGAADVDAYWRNLKAGVESVTFFSDAELRDSDVAPERLEDPDYVKAGAVLDDVEGFDAAFFGFSPREAGLTDPQHRVFLECAWEALEHAGYTPDSHNGAIAVYGGAAMNGYLLHNLATRPDVAPNLFDFQIQIGNDKDYLTTRVSYKLNLKGPSVNVQTACSTSLAAVHMACQSLLNGECNLALAGGVSVSVPHRVGYLYRDAGLNSKDGHCRAFDAEASGTVLGSGAGIVVLKRLADALADGDHIHALIKGSAINNDGNAKVGYTAPGLAGQAAVVAEALAVAGLRAEDIGYVEAHGTGTPMGDPIEVKALAQAFHETTRKKGYCALGSVKTNIGHMDVASGVAGLIKAALAVKHGQIPPSLNFRRPNPEIDFEDSPFFVNTRLSDWAAPIRRAGVSSFGLGGTNVHAVLEQPPAAEAARPSRPWQLLPLSAKMASALERMGERLAAHWQSHPESDIADAAFTLQTGREAFARRRAFLCHDRASLLDALSGQAPGQVFTGTGEAHERPIVFMFPGQGSQYVGMGRQLYAVEPAFKAAFDRCAALLQAPLGADLRELVYPPAGQEAAAAVRLQQTGLTQPALFAVEYALAMLWMEWGIRPQAMIGHSVGEYVAACLAGVMSLEDAAKLVAARGRMMQDLPGGAMLAVDLPEDRLGGLAAQGLALAAVNAPGRCVLSGAEEAVAAMEQRLTGEGHRCRRLHTSHAFHSDMMEPILDEFTRLVSTISLRPPQIPLISNLTGTWMRPEEATDPSYYARHLRHTVRFSDGLRELAREPGRLLLEVGPGRTLSALAQQTLADMDNAPGLLWSMRHPQQEEADAAVLLAALGKLWVTGVAVDWRGFYAHERRHRLPLPAYPFERQRHWIEPGRLARVPAKASGPSARPVAKKRPVADWFYRPAWKLAALPPPGPAGGPACWLVFATAAGLGERLASRLEAAQQDVVIVLPGERSGWIDARRYRLDPAQPAEYGKLADALEAVGKPPARIVHAWNTDLAPAAEPDLAAFARAQELGFNSLVFLAQAFGGRTLSDSLKIAALSTGAQAVTGDEALCPERATLSAACIVVSQEYTNLDCRHIDLAPPAAGGTEENGLILRVLEEIAADPPDALVAYRGDGRWVQDNPPVRLADGQAGVPARLRQRGVYLITGGLGAIGFVLAQYLADSVQARLVLVGRSALPERGEWTRWLEAHAEDDATSLKIQRARALEALGAEVLVVSADAADPEQMRAALAEARQRFGRIDGVIHGAGVVEEEAFLAVQDLGKASAERHFRPKVHGLLALHGLLKDQEPDFYLLLSSISSLVGGLGYAAYASANGYLDAYAQKQARQSKADWISVNWDAWLFGPPASGQPGLGAIVSDLAMSPEEGVEAFRRILGGGTAGQIAVSTTDLATRLDQWVKRKPRPAQPAPRPEAAQPGASEEGGMRQVLAAIWRDVLGVKHIEPQDNFFDLGGDSLLLVDVIGRLKSDYGIVLNPREIMFQTLGQIAAACEEKRAAKAAAPQFAPPPGQEPRKGGLFASVKRKIGLGD